METERTYCFTTVCNKTRRLLESFLEVVFEPLVLVLFGTQLHEFTWKDKNLRVQYMKIKERYSSVIKSGRHRPLQERNVKTLIFIKTHF